MGAQSSIAKWLAGLYSTLGGYMNPTKRGDMVKGKELRERGREERKPKYSE